jgi:molybdopterin-guanine dinucleotide biosynthesis protein A
MGGGDKGLLPLGGSTVLGHALGRLRPQAGPLALNANGDPARFAALGLPVLPDSVAGRPGPLAGVLAAMDWAAGMGAERVLTAAADTPFLPADLVARLSERPGIVLAATPGPLRHPTFGLWPVALREDLRAALARGVRKVVAWTDRHGAAEALFPDEAAFFNVNTPEDLARAREMAA